MARTLLALYVLVLLSVLAVVAARPVAFQKVATVTRGSSEIPALAEGAALDVERVVGGIPFVPEDERLMLWEVDPDRKYQLTLLEGAGNCSNLVFGLARYLDREGIDFQIVHLMWPERVLLGRGHTVIRTRYVYDGQERVGLVDVFARGLPRSGDAGFLDEADLRRGVDAVEFVTWKGSGSHERSARFYEEINEGTVLGWIPAEDVKRYFRYLDRFYVPLGNPRLEKYLYDGVAVLLGVLPRVHVADLHLLGAANPLAWSFFPVALWLLRSAIVVLPLLAWWAWRESRSAQRSGGVQMPSRAS